MPYDIRALISSKAVNSVQGTMLSDTGMVCHITSPPLVIQIVTQKDHLQAFATRAQPVPLPLYRRADRPSGDQDRLPGTP